MMDFLKQFTNPSAWWAVVGLVLILMEFAIPGLILFFFGLGALLVALICLVFEISLTWQLLFFSIGSVILLLLLRRTVARVFTGKVGADDGRVNRADEIAGQKAITLSAIDPQQGGKVEFHGTDWKAEADAAIGKGQMVQIVRQEGLTLIVEPREPAAKRVEITADDEPSARDTK